MPTITEFSVYKQYIEGGVSRLATVDDETKPYTAATLRDIYRMAERDLTSEEMDILDRIIDQGGVEELLWTQPIDTTFQPMVP